MVSFLDFEKPIAELQARIGELRDASGSDAADIEPELVKLEAKAERLLRDTYAKLTPWQKTQVARHPERPHFKGYIAGMVDDFMPLAGDRAFGDDQAILGGFGRGLRFIKPTADNPNKPRQIWSQGESEFNRYWFPSYDTPNDFRTTDIKIKVAKPFFVVSNGKLASTKENPDGTRTFDWGMDQP